MLQIKKLKLKGLFFITFLTFQFLYLFFPFSSATQLLVLQFFLWCPCYYLLLNKKSFKPFTFPFPFLEFKFIRDLWPCLFEDDGKIQFARRLQSKHGNVSAS